MKFTFGSDPEFMVTKDGKYFNAAGLVQGDAERRINIKGHEFYFDNVMAECAVKPGSTRKEVIDNFRECLAIYADMVRPFKLHIQGSQEYSREQIELWPSWMDPTKEECPPGLKVGCSPDWCAYAMKMMDPPKAIMQNGSLRSCGGHIHLGAPIAQNQTPDSIRVIYMLDLFLGIPSLWLDTDPTAARRRSLYGQAGRFRPKDYGLEYRSLSNFWLANPELVGLIYDLCEFALEFVESGKAGKMWEFDEEVFFSSENLSDAWTNRYYDTKVLRQVIDDGDGYLGHAFYLTVKDLLPKKLWDAIQKCIGSNRDLYSAWKL